jgi:DeoR/GlpR family transcriptional regulator of sugar metabolism
MLARQRQERILAEVRRHGGARVSDLVELLGVSDMTVRRDIEALARQELVLRVHGGATAVEERSSDEPGFQAKSGLAMAEKSAIAQLAATLIRPGASVALSAGTTTYAVARELVEVPDLTVVTNSPPVADLLHERPAPGRTVVLTGGTRTPSNALVGPVAVRALQDLHVDTLVLGVHGIDEHAGLTTPNLVEAETNQALVASARRVVVVADHTKWNVVGLAGIAALERVDVLVTDAGLPKVARRTLTGLVGELLVAEPPPAPAAVPESRGEAS